MVLQPSPHFLRNSWSKKNLSRGHSTDTNMGSNPEESGDRNSSGSGTPRDENTPQETSRSNSIASSAKGKAEHQRGGAGQTAGQILDSARYRLSTPAAKHHLKYVIKLFALIGAGFGITGYLIIELVASKFADLAGGGEIVTQLFFGLFSLTMLVFLLLIGPVIAVYSGLNTDDDLYQEPRTAYLTNFVGNAAGYLLMIVIAIMLVNIALGGGGNAAQIEQNQFESSNTASNTGGNIHFIDMMVQIIPLSIPIGLVGLGSAYLHQGRNSGTNIAS